MQYFENKNSNKVGNSKRIAFFRCTSCLDIDIQGTEYINEARRDVTIDVKEYTKSRSRYHLRKHHVIVDAVFMH